MPDDLAGMIGLPYVGGVFYVDPSGGADTNSGLQANDALKTVDALYDKLTSGQQEVGIINPTGGTGRTSETTAITWGKRFTHLIGNAGPLAQDARAGIGFATGGSLTISENGCIFKNLTFNGTADINVPVTLTGDYNSFIGVDFKGSLNDTTGDDTAARALYINGGQENTFIGCTLGADTFTRSAANATLEFASAASRNVFEGCRFLAWVDAATPVHVLLTGTNAIDRWLEFRDCSFTAMSSNDGTAVTACMNLSAQGTTGQVWITGNPFLGLGITDWEATASGRIHMQAFSVTANTLGLAIKPTVS